ncbi:hypothetical protein HN51_057750 [Arachis hypogaea]
MNDCGERFDRLMDQVTGVFNVLLTRAAIIPRNYIIDQTNVHKNARKHKLKPFADYQKIAVVVFPNPEELKVRCDKRFKETGKKVPPDSLKNIIANYVLPKSMDMPNSDEYFDQMYLDQMKQDLTSISNSSSSQLQCSDSFHSLAGSPLQNQESFTGGVNHGQGIHSQIYPSNYRMPSQVNTNVHVVDQHHGSMNSFFEVDPGSQIPPVPRAPSPCGRYPINRNEANEAFPISNAATMPFDYHRSYNDNSGFQRHLQTPSSATPDSVSPIGIPKPSLRPPDISFPDYKPYPGNTPQRPRYY